MVELRHDCSVDKDKTNPTFERELWTSLVYRLKQPVMPQCSADLDKAFIWKFELTQEEKCRGMLGCHYTNDNDAGMSIQDMVFEVCMVEIRKL